jgi:hypothetical protein
MARKEIHTLDLFEILDLAIFNILRKKKREKRKEKREKRKEK